MKKEVVRVESVCDLCDEPADFSCDQCGMDFCHSCWNKSGGKVIYFSVVDECSEKMERFCSGCSQKLHPDMLSILEEFSAHENKRKKFYSQHRKGSEALDKKMKNLLKEHRALGIKYGHQ
jgi:hypothetical protein